MNPTPANPSTGSRGSSKTLLSPFGFMKTNVSESTAQPTPGAATSPARRADPSMFHLKRILVPLDFSEHSLKGLRYAIPFAESFGAKLTILHVIPPPVYSAEVVMVDPGQPELSYFAEKQLKAIREQMVPAHLETELVLRHTFAFDGILEAARENEADLIIVTTHGRTGMKHFMMGSTAENIVRRAPCPVLVVRDDERDFV